MITFNNSKIIKAFLIFVISNTQEARSSSFFSISFLLLNSTVEVASVQDDCILRHTEALPVAVWGLESNISLMAKKWIHKSELFLYYIFNSTNFVR